MIHINKYIAFALISIVGISLSVSPQVVIYGLGVSGLNFHEVALISANKGILCLLKGCDI